MKQPSLDLIDLDQDLPGQQRFISCWLSRQDGLAFIVDPGPQSSVGRLIARLRTLGVDRLDFILLTHVHLDHAGGTAEVVRAFPGVRVICHAKGRPHLVEPTKLWRGSREVLGRFAEAYGPPGPVPEAAIGTAAEAERRQIRILETPGHAAHHLSFFHEGTLYVGEAAGTYMAIPGGEIFQRPATPPQFFLAPALASLDRLLALTPEPARMAFSHYGLAEGRVHRLLRAAREQLQRWVEVARQEMDAETAMAPGRTMDTTSGPDPASPGPVESRFGEEAAAALLVRTRARLFATDPLLAVLKRLGPEIREREYGFTVQTLQGIFGHLQREA
jgi:glyoxylase-like metal-dependent hydrolase (beta-lactamase superfamily II)